MFDFDGTLTMPGLIDFMAIKKEINCPRDRPILEFIAALPSAGKRRAAAGVLERFEDKAAEAAKPNAYAEEIILFLRSAGFKLGIITRNRMRSVEASLPCFQKVSAKDFDVIVTRETVSRLKPHPEGVLFAACCLKVDPWDMAVVGDYVFDIEAGQRAGAMTVFLESSHTVRRPEPPADLNIKELKELKLLFKK